MIGIYKITNKINNKIYIGQSNNVENRISGHMKCLINNKHKNKHLQGSFNKYGINNFLFEIVEICNEAQLNERETYWIKYYKSYLPENGYNKIISSFYKPIKLFDNDIQEIKNIFLDNKYVNIKMVSKKYNVSISYIYGILRDLKIKRNKSKLMTIEQKQKISNSLKGRKLSKEHYNNVKLANQRSHGNTSTTEKQIKEVIGLLLQNKTNKEISNLTGISYTIINDVRHKKTWLSLTKNIEFPKVKDEQLKLNEEQAKEVIQLILNGNSLRGIAKQYNVSVTVIRNIKEKKTWKHLTENINF